MRAEDKTPDLVGTMGKAWKYDIEEAVRNGSIPEWTLKTNIGSWIVFAPYAHMLWSYYYIGCVTLEDVEGVDSANIVNEGANTEILVIALNPDHEVSIDGPLYHLTPINFAGQWEAGSKEEANDRLKKTVQEVIDGVLSPDTDYISMWRARFGSSCLRK